MREEKILYARCGELELRLEPLPPQSTVHVAEAQPPRDEAEDERRSLETLLHSTSVDPDVYARAFSKLRTA